MRHFFKILISSIVGLIIVLSSCKHDFQEENKEIFKEDLKTFADSVWTFNITGDTRKDKVIGMWLSTEVRYNDQLSQGGDSLFTWVIESTGRMVKRNNSWPSLDKGIWKLDEKKEFIIFYWDSASFYYKQKGIVDFHDSIRIIRSVSSELQTSHYINSTTKMKVKFIRLMK